MDYTELPGIHPREYETLEAAVKRAAVSGSSIYKNEKTEDFIKSYMSGCDGHATERIADYIMGKAWQRYVDEENSGKTV